MRGRFVAGSIILAIMTSGVAVEAARATMPAPPDFGRLFRISKAGIPDSYVLGTLHAADPRAATLSPPVIDAMARTRTLAVELVPQERDPQLVELEQLDAGQQLESLIGPAAYAKVRDRLLLTHVPETVIRRLKPWAAMMRFARDEGAPGGPTLDGELMSAARKNRMKVLPLEMVDEQISAFDAIPLGTQVALLRHVIDHRDTLQLNAEATIEAWLHGDLGGLYRIASNIDGRFPAMTRHYTTLIEHMIEGRTTLMHHRLFLPLREGRVFVAIGALHLQGKKGLLALLREDRYRVTQVW